MRWREKGGGSWRPVNVLLRGADCTTLSFANCDAEGGTMERPGGGRFLLNFSEPKGLDSGSFESLPSPLADFCSLDSMMDRCWSRTAMLRCNCSCRPGSCV